MNIELQKKIDRAIKLLKAAEKKAAEVGQPVEICYSGGKDSDVILELAKMAEINYRAIYKNTTIDAPGTIKHVQDMGVEMIRPKESFAQLIYKKGWPSRRVRWCCSELKEYKVLDYAVVGIRREESKKRAELYKEPEICRVYNAKEKTRQYLPLLDWTLSDVQEFLTNRGITCASVYYDSDGIFHPERRLGCIGCPLQNRNARIREFEKYPNLVKMYLRGGYFYRQNNRLQKNKYYFKNIFEWFVCYLFCDSITEFRERFGPNLFDGGIDCKKFLENYFHIDLDEFI